MTLRKAQDKDFTWSFIGMICYTIASQLTHASYKELATELGSGDVVLTEWI